MKSMTGFGRAEVRSETFRLGVEITSVNRKQSDIVFHLPREWAALEIEARKLVAGHVSRGRVQVQIKHERMESHHAPLQVDRTLAAQYVAELRKLGLDLNLSGDVSALDLLRAPGVFSAGECETPAEDIWPLLQSGLAQALAAFDKSRAREGAHLRKDLESRLTQLRSLLNAISQQAAEVPKVQRETMRRRLSEAGLPLPLEDERLLKEIALFADRCDISEEISRLGGHLEEFAHLMESGEPQGRAMDFLTQEMNRELNTMGSKGSSTAIAHLVVAGKTEVERIREQVQNVE